MKNFNFSALALALVICLAFGVDAMDKSMSKEQYKSLEKLEAEYKVDKAGCNSFAGNANDICVAEAKGKMNIAKAELEAKYKPSAKTRYDARVAIPGPAGATGGISTQGTDGNQGETGKSGDSTTVVVIPLATPAPAS